ncbi:MAG: DUF6291 domain-containing protein [Oscillospiraceae bacterium]
MEKKIAINDSAIILKSTWESIQLLEDKDQLETLKILLNYSFYDESVETDNKMINLVLLQALPNINSCNQRYKKAKENGEKGGRPVKYDIEKIVELRNNKGFTLKQIAQELNCHVNTVQNALKNYKDGVIQEVETTNAGDCNKKINNSDIMTNDNMPFNETEDDEFKLPF